MAKPQGQRPNSMPAPSKAVDKEEVPEMAPSLDVENDEEAEMLDGVSDKSVAPVEPKKKKLSGPINVRATRAGFIYNSRKAEGDLFTIKSEEELGSWMEII